MKLIKEQLDVDFSTSSRPLTEEEHAEVSEFIKKSKAAYAARTKRKRAHKPAKKAKA